MVINLLSTFIEDYVMSQFLFSYFHIHSKIKLVLLVSICTIETFIINDILSNNDILVGTLVMTYVVFLALNNKKFEIYTFALPVLMISLVVLSNCISLVLTSLCFDLTIAQIPNTTQEMITSILISRILLILFISALYYFIKKHMNHIHEENRWLLILFMLVIVIMLISLVESNVYHQFKNQLIFNLFVELIIIAIICIVLYINVQRQNRMNIRVKEELMKNEYQSKMYHMMDRMFQKIMIDKHMMIYNLMKIELLLKIKNYDEAEDFTSKELKKLLNYKYLSSTGNILFDYEMTELVNELREKNINVKTVFTIDKDNKILSHDEVVDMIVQIIETISHHSTRKIELFFSEVQDHLVFKMLVIHDQTIEDKIIDDYQKNSYIKRLNVKNEKIYTEFHFLIAL